MSAKKIEKLLHTALLKQGKMVRALYEYELEEHLDLWKASMRRDGDEFILAVTEHSGHVAMALLHEADGLFVNEDARHKLQELWADKYAHNVKKLIPYWAAQLSAGSLPLMGVKTVDTPGRRWDVEFGA
jgi:hypothetical protein